MALPRKFYPDAVPAPLRIPPKPPRRSSSPPLVSPATPASITSARCPTLSRLPPQPVFRSFSGESQEATTATSPTRCNCHISHSIPPTPSPTSPPVSPLSLSSPRSSFSSSCSSLSSFARGGGLGGRGVGPSLDFSALSMRSLTLRQDLENCQCHLSRGVDPGGGSSTHAPTDFIARQIATLRRDSDANMSRSGPSVKAWI